MKRITKSLISRIYNASISWTPAESEEIVGLRIPTNNATKTSRSACIIRGVIYDSRYQVAFRNRFSVVSETVNGVYPFPVDPFRLLQSATPLGDVLHTSFRSRWNNHYHLLIDLIPRLLLLNLPEVRRLGQIKLLAPGGLTSNEEFIFSKLGLPGQATLTVPDRNLLSIPRYLFLPFLSRPGSGFVPRWCQEIIRSTMCPKRPSQRNLRILLSRQSARKRRILNFDELEHSLSPFGFVAISPEKLSFQEQIELFYDAETVIGSHGAGLANLIFATEASVVEIMPADMNLLHYSDLCRSMGHQYISVLPSVPSPGELCYPTDGRIRMAADLRRFEALRDRHVTVDTALIIDALAELKVI